ncbi:MAG: hypothetical protein ACYC1U_05380 [Candidatus Aquicultorales bacterium]
MGGQTGDDQVVPGAEIVDGETEPVLVPVIRYEALDQLGIFGRLSLERIADS